MTHPLYIGMLSGTSMDAVDCALVDFSSASPRIVDFICEEIDPGLKKSLLLLAANQQHDLRQLGNADIAVAELFARTVQRLLAKNGGLSPRQIEAIGSHGQTIWHEPPQTAQRFSFSLQIGDPNTLAERTGITVVADFRRKDMAAGGQGAPIVPALHRAVFHSAAADRIILNLGGIANVTFLPRSGARPLGFDTGPASVLMDAWIWQHLQREYDEDGRWAAGGTVDVDLLAAMLDEPYFRLPPPKSTGREFLNLAWLECKLGAKQRAPQDVQATLLEFTAETVSTEILRLVSAGEVVLCGGGARNGALIERLKAKLPGFKLFPSGELGIHSDCVEAVAFAWLAKQTLSRQPVDLTPFTGARHPVIAGGIYYAERANDRDDQRP